jgi:Asp-tRNA(Asn)/Glu-tRNA(Gln) amidotransferase A subunit family amidase
VLAGLPILVKDNINTRGRLTTGGTPALRHACPTTTAPTLQALPEAGAIVLAKTNLHELAFGITSTNLAASGIEGIGLADVAAQVASPDVRGAFSAILADAFGGENAEAMTVHRPAMQALYAQWFAANHIDAMLFPTTIAAAVPIDAEPGSGTVCFGGGPELDTFATFIRNTGPASNAGLPGLSIPAGLTAGGLPVGLEIDGPLGSDRRLLGIGLSIETVLGHAPAAAAGVTERVAPPQVLPTRFSRLAMSSACSSSSARTSSSMRRVVGSCSPTKRIISR